jgi:autotransporter adhesin
VFGANSQGTATNATAIGQAAVASGTNSTSLGQGAVASGTNSTALGQGAQATFANSTAIGAGAVTTSANQVVIGGPGTHVAFPSILGNGAQTGRTTFVTADGGGNLGTSFIGPDDLIRQDNRLRDGVALALAAGGSPSLQPGRRFAVSANFGTFDGAGAFAAGATALLMDTKQYSVVGNASVGVGFQTNVVGGRGGVSFQW